jgi:hypothetical protein
MYKWFDFEGFRTWFMENMRKRAEYVPFPYVGGAGQPPTVHGAEMGMLQPSAPAQGQSAMYNAVARIPPYNPEGPSMPFMDQDVKEGYVYMIQGDALSDDGDERQEAQRPLPSFGEAFGRRPSNDQIHGLDAQEWEGERRSPTPPQQARIFRTDRYSLPVYDDDHLTQILNYLECDLSNAGEVPWLGPIPPRVWPPVRGGELIEYEYESGRVHTRTPVKLAMSDKVEEYDPRREFTGVCVPPSPGDGEWRPKERDPRLGEPIPFPSRPTAQEIVTRTLQLAEAQLQALSLNSEGTKDEASASTAPRKCEFKMLPPPTSMVAQEGQFVRVVIEGGDEIRVDYIPVDRFMPDVILDYLEGKDVARRDGQRRLPDPRTAYPYGRR